MKYRNIVVAGDVGTGTSTLSKSLANKFGWKYLANGDIYRAYVKQHGINLWDHEAVPDDIDRKIDQEFLDKVTNEQGFVFDTHYGGYFAKDLEDVFRILLTCDPEEAERRILSREHTHSETVEDIRKRRDENQKKFNKLYDPGSPEDPKYFNLILDTTESNPEKTLEQTLKAIEA